MPGGPGGPEASRVAFLASLAETKEFLKCPQCNDLYIEPVRSMSCRHTVCARHRGDFCAQCGRDVRGCEFRKDHVMEAAAEAMRVIEEIYGVQDSPTESIQEPEKATYEPPSETPTRKSIDLSIMTSSITSKRATKQSTKSEKSATHAYAEDTSKDNVDSNTPKRNLEKRNIKGETGLQIACRLGKFESIVKYIELGANPNTKDNAGWTPLHEVTQRGDARSVTYLLEHGALPDVPGCDNETPLHEAVRYGHVDIAKNLAMHGADVRAKNIKGETPLSLADEKTRQALLDAAKTQKELDISSCVSAAYDDVRVLCVSSSMAALQKVKKLEKSHNNLQVESKFTPKVTHLIVDTENDNTCVCTIDVLLAVVKGAWVLSTEWISQSTEINLEKFERFEVAGIGSPNFNGLKLSRLNKYKQLPGLFDGCHVYLHGFSTQYEISKYLVLTKSLLTTLITNGGGKILTREPNPESIPDSERTVPYHANESGKLAKCSHFIVFADMFQPMYNMEHLKALPVGWLIECIQKHTLCDPW